MTCSRAVFLARPPKFDTSNPLLPTPAVAMFGRSTT
jgi:hypothetical protein